MSMTRQNCPKMVESLGYGMYEDASFMNEFDLIEAESWGMNE